MVGISATGIRIRRALNLAVEEKEGRAGPFVLTHVETTYTNQHGDVVAVSRLVGIAR